jgi:hypothetical protein
MEGLYLSCTIAALIVYLFTKANDDVTIQNKVEEQRLRMNVQEDRMNILLRQLKRVAQAYKSKRSIIADYRDKRRTQEIVKERMAAEMNYDMAKEQFADTIIEMAI